MEFEYVENFTKEELEEIAEMMRHARKQGIDTRHNLTYDVEDKVRKMLENYSEPKCDHRQWIAGAIPANSHQFNNKRK